MSLALLALALAPCAPQEPDLPFAVPGGAERYRASLARARELAASHLPSLDELGPGWRRPWELPVGVPGGLSEDAYWRSMRPRDPIPHWIWFHGLRPDEVHALLDEGLSEMREFLARAEASGELEEAGAMREFVTVAGLMRLMTALNRLRNGVVAESQPVYAVRNADFLDVTLRMSGNEGQEAQLDAMRTMFDTFTPDLADAGEAAVLDAYVREATLVRAWTGMTYVHASDADLLAGLEDVDADAPPEIPKYGKFTVTLHIVRRDAIGDRVPRRSAEDLPALGRDLERHLENVARELAPGFPVDYAVDVEPRDLGDEAWVLLIDADAAVPGVPSMTGAFGRVRSGNAIIDVKGEGTYAQEWIGRQLDYLLEALAARAELYSDDG